MSDLRLFLAFVIAHYSGRAIGSADPMWLGGGVITIIACVAFWWILGGDE